MIVKALVWHFSGSRRRGIQVAAATGLVLAVMAIVLGLWLVLAWRTSSGLWLGLLGWFGLEAASAQLQLLRLQDQLRQLRVQQVQGRRYRILDAHLDLQTVSRQLAQETTEMGPQDWLLVYEGHRWLGRFSPRPSRRCRCSVGHGRQWASNSSPGRDPQHSRQRPPLAGCHGLGASP